MKRSRLILLVILSAALSAGLTSWLTRSWQPDRPFAPPDDEAESLRQDFHQWLHTNLELNDEQKQALAPLEQRFEVAHTRLEEELDTISTRLAHALGDPAMQVEDLRPFMEKRHAIQNQLQELMVDHLIEKRDLLTVDQRERYREWIHRSIPHHHED